MKIASKVLNVLWILFVSFIVLTYGLSLYVGNQFKEVIDASVTSQGRDYFNYSNVISENDFTKLWTPKVDEASFEQVDYDNKVKTQEYSVSTPQFMNFSTSSDAFLTYKKMTYTYNYQTFDKSGKQINNASAGVQLDVKFIDGNWTITKVYYDEYEDMNIGGFDFLLVIILLLNAFVRNIKYFDYCKLAKRKSNPLHFIQHYVFFVLALAYSLLQCFFNVDILLYVIIIGVLQELIFNSIFHFGYRKDRNKLKDC